MEPRPTRPRSASREALARRPRRCPAGTFGPFTAATAFDESSAPVCAYWPFATAAPETTITALPNVPTLIISGADDLRTPTANADAVKALIPDATIVVVPQTGHSALTTEFGTCGQTAVNAFFAGTAIDDHLRARKLSRITSTRPTPLPLLAGDARPGRRPTGASGRTAHAVELTHRLDRARALARACSRR